MRSTGVRHSRKVIVVDESHDNVAVACRDLNRGFKYSGVTLLHSVRAGQRFAIYDIPRGKPILQYGSPFGISRGIKAGSLVSAVNLKNIDSFPGLLLIPHPSAPVFDQRLLSMTFKGFKRANGSAGTRNYYLVIPTSQCSSSTALQITAQADRQLLRLVGKTSEFDGFISIPNTEGCGCASNFQIDRVFQVIKNFMCHPNVGGVLLVDLGCEQTNRIAFQKFLRKEKNSISAPVDWLTIQAEGGVSRTVGKALKIMAGRLSQVCSIRRVPCPVSAITVGTECGASDTFSGITANPVIGSAVDRIISGKGCGILSEVPEMVGAEQILMKRMRNRKVTKDFIDMMKWYIDIAREHHVDMSDNLVPENKAGGLINTCIKSLGAIAKGGISTIEGILDYGEKIKGRGLYLMQGPGNDLESVTGLVSSGANVICFSTGKGTVTGSAIVPVIKISSTTSLYNRMKTDIDFNAGTLLDRTDRSVDSLGEELLNMVIGVCSGKRTKAEMNQQAQFQIWTAGKLSL